MVIAIDGPPASGKGTITEMLSKKLNFETIDTGATYRMIARKLLDIGFIKKHKNVFDENINNFLNSEEGQNIKSELKEILNNTEIKIEEDENLSGIESKRYILNGEDVTDKIRTQDVNNIVAVVSSISIVREKLVDFQREYAKGKDIVMDGRDIGTVVFPDAEVKIYLSASLDERSKRRYKQDKKKAELKEEDFNLTLEDIKKSIYEREKIETERKDSPLMQAEDAIFYDNTGESIEETVNNIVKIVIERRN